MLVVRDGELPTGSLDCLVRSTAAVAILGTGAEAAVAEVLGALGLPWAQRVHLVAAEVNPNDRVGIAELLEPMLVDSATVLLPASPDGRDLAPYLAARLGRQLVANCADLSEHAAVCLRQGGTSMVSIALTSPVVCTLQPVLGDLSRVRGEEEPASEANQQVAKRVGDGLIADIPGDRADRLVQTITVHPPDPATVDLAEAHRILGLGDGAMSSADELFELGERLGCAVGATRVVTDAGVMGHDRQIGTTGVVVHPELYVAFGISGAVQHTAGLGDPAHVISVNLDPHCPMMHMADLAIVADAPATIAALVAAAPQGVTHG